MATIVPTIMGIGKVAVILTTLTGTADVFVYFKTGRQVLVLRNATAGALSPIIDGDGATTVAVAGVGNVDVSAGFAVGSIAAGAAVAIELNKISAYLVGTIAITGGTGLVAELLTF